EDQQGALSGVEAPPQLTLGRAAAATADREAARLERLDGPADQQDAGHDRGQQRRQADPPQFDRRPGPRREHAPADSKDRALRLASLRRRTARRRAAAARSPRARVPDGHVRRQRACQCSILIEFIRSGFEVLPCRLPKLSSFLSTSMPSITRPNTGCCDGVLLSHQSRNELCAVLMKNWLPPLLGRPVLAIDSVPGSLENFAF